MTYNGQISAVSGVTRTMANWGFGVAFALGSAAFGCDGTAGPLLVRNPVGGAPGFAGATSAAGVASTAGAGATPGGTSVRPASDVSWQIQLSGKFDASVDVALYYVDLDNLTNAELLTLRNAGRHVACYLSAGTYEPWRTDAASFPEEVLGNALSEYPNERWLDVLSSAVRSLMSGRIERMQSAGCSSVVVANVTTSGEDSGFDMTVAEQSSYLLSLSDEIHQRGLLAGLATAEDRLALMEPNFDWAYAQSCWVAAQCSAYASFVAASKAVLAVEIGDSATSAALCRGVLGSGINLLVKSQDLGASRIACLP